MKHMSIRRTTALLAAVSTLVFAQPASAVSDAEAALLGAIGAQALGGKTTLGEHGGEMETAIIAASLLHSAAMKITVDVGRTDGVIVATETEATNIGIAQSVGIQIDRVNMNFDALHCDGKPNKSNVGVGSVLASVISEAPKATTVVSGQSVTIGNEALVDAMLKNNIKWTRLGDISVADRDSPLANSWQKLRLRRDSVATRACGTTDKGKAAIAGFDALESKLLAAGEGGAPSLLELAMRLDKRVDSSTRILRVHIEKAGGSVINTDTFWTRLGAPAIRITGGLIIGYRLINPYTGQSEKSGLLVCVAPKKGIRAIYSGNLPGADPNLCQTFEPTTAHSGATK